MVSVFSTDQREAFQRDGFVYLPRALPADQVDAMRDQMWAILTRHGATSSDPSTWNSGQTQQLQTIRRHDPSPAASPPVAAALDDTLGRGTWTCKPNWQQALVTYPVPGPWTLPNRVWHLDHPYWHPPDRIVAVNLFLLLDDVMPQGGATLVVKGSHRVVARFVPTVEGLTDKKMKPIRLQFDAHHEWFRDLTRTDDEGRVTRLMDTEGDVDGVSVRVTELTGRAGDVVLCHPWLVHAGSPNVLDQPRLMRVARVRHRTSL